MVARRHLAQTAFDPHIFLERAVADDRGGVRPQIAFMQRMCLMTKLTLGSHPFLLGFDQLERLVERTAKSGNDGYPPYNIEQRGENAYRITLAVAGFADADLSITVEDRQLVIRGKHRDDDDARVFLHRGIAARQFQRSFVLADGVEVAGASMEHGLLHIDLKRAVPDSVVQTIRINSAKAEQ
ncbi:Small heat shock protein [Roseibacterium elongatum DSM 19469]|uniref:Small heat shock protein n=2 Tax=Roseicyclus elongatus TaxID=159346 RepID=W8RT61_9RHOB|nr:Small heat shock protein [Roseibacterium elongatum DSM 19469]